MPNFVDDLTDLDPKIAYRPTRPGAEDYTIRAEDWNRVVNACYDLRSAVLSSGVSDGDKGDITVTTGVWSIDTNVVSLSKLAQIATARFLGRTSASTGDVESLTGTQATALLDTFTSGNKGLAPASGGSSSDFLCADGTWENPRAAPIVASTVLGASASTITVSGLDGDTDREYTIEFNYIATSTAAHEVDIRPNGDTASNRPTSRVLDGGSPVLVSTGIIISNGAVTQAIRVRATFTCYVPRDTPTYYRRFSMNSSLSWNNGAGNGGYQSWTTYGSDTSNLTSLTLGITTTQFAAGSELIVRKMTR